MSLLDRPRDASPPSLDDVTADRLLAGLIPPDDAPPGYAGVARLVIAAHRPPSAAELADMDPAVRAALWVLRETATESLPFVARARRARLLVRTKVTALVFAGTLVGTSGMAAAGALPAPVQDVAARVLSTVGIHVPHSADRDSTVPETGTTTGSRGADEGARSSPAARPGHGHEGEHGQANLDHGSAPSPHGHSTNGHGNGNGVQADPNGRPDDPGQPGDPRGQTTTPPGQADPDPQTSSPSDDPTSPSAPNGGGHASGQSQGNGQPGGKTLSSSIAARPAV